MSGTKKFLSPVTNPTPTPYSAMSLATPSTATLEHAEQLLRDLMQRGLSGDAQAHARLLTELAGLLRRFYQRRLQQQPADVEDLVQETLIAVHTRRATYDTTQPFTAWAYAIARYKLIDHLRRERRATKLNIDDCQELFGADDIAAFDANRDVSDVLSALPSAQRDAIAMTRLEGLSVEEAAARTGQSVSGIKVGVHRGLKKLTALFGQSPDQ